MHASLVAGKVLADPADVSVEKNRAVAFVERRGTRCGETQLQLDLLEDVQRLVRAFYEVGFVFFHLNNRWSKKRFLLKLQNSFAK